MMLKKFLVLVLISSLSGLGAISAPLIDQGFGNNILNDDAIGIGSVISISAIADHAVGIGYEVEIKNPNTLGLGRNLKIEAPNSYLIGFGASKKDKLVNKTSDSLAFGVNTLDPTIYIINNDTNSSFVGIDTDNPTHKLTVNGGIMASGKICSGDKCLDDLSEEINSVNTQISTQKLELFNVRSSVLKATKDVSSISNKIKNVEDDISSSQKSIIEGFKYLTADESKIQIGSGSSTNAGLALGRFAISNGSMATAIGNKVKAQGNNTFVIGTGDNLGLKGSEDQYLTNDKPNTILFGVANQSVLRVTEKGIKIKGVICDDDNPKTCVDVKELLSGLSSVSSIVGGGSSSVNSSITVVKAYDLASVAKSIAEKNQSNLSSTDIKLNSVIQSITDVRQHIFRPSGNITLGSAALGIPNKGYGNGNIALGRFALLNAKSGSGNIVIGDSAAYSIVSGSNNIIIGGDKDSDSDDIKEGVNNTLNIGDSIYGDLSSKKIGIGTETPDATLDIAGNIKIQGGSPGLNKVLVSDAQGLASWKDVNTIVNFPESNTSPPAQTTITVPPNLTAVTLETASFKLTGGNPGSNKILTSDASGNAIWKDLSELNSSGSSESSENGSTLVGTLGLSESCPSDRQINSSTSGTICFESATKHPENHRLNWSEANTWALLNGGRLPTREELSKTSGLTPSWDNKYLWTVESCSSGSNQGYYAYQRGSSSGSGFSRCVPLNRKLRYSLVSSIESSGIGSISNAEEVTYKLRVLSTAPSSAEIGEVYMDNSGAYCVAFQANTWTKIAGDGSCQ